MLEEDNDSLADDNQSQVSNGTAGSRQRPRISRGGRRGESRRASELSKQFDEEIESGERYLDLELDMYFTDPNQLLDIFQDIEEDNLFLIELQQDLESEVEKINSEFIAIQKIGDAK